jgi:hypothetical protein
MTYPDRYPVTPWCGIPLSDLRSVGTPEIVTIVQRGRLEGYCVRDNGAAIGLLGVRVMGGDAVSLSLAGGEDDDGA